MYEQLLALANGDRVKENQRGKIAFVVDMDKKHAAEDLLKSLTSYHKELLSQVCPWEVPIAKHFTKMMSIRKVLSRLYLIREGWPIFLQKVATICSIY